MEKPLDRGQIAIMPDTQSPTPAPSKSILTSRTFAGLALIALPLLAKPLGYTLDDAATQALVENIFQIIGLAVAAYGRLKASKTVTLTGPVAAPNAAAAKSARREEGSTLSETASALAGTILGILFAILALAYLTGCATTTRSGRVTNAVLLTAGKFAGKVLIASVANAASDRAKGLQLDYAASASAGLWANMDSVVTSADIERVIAAYAGPAAPALAAPLAAQFDAVQPRTPADRSALVDSMARGISDAAALLAPQGREGK